MGAEEVSDGWGDEGTENEDAVAKGAETGRCEACAGAGCHQGGG